MVCSNFVVFAEMLMVASMFRAIATQQCGVEDTYSVSQWMLKGHTYKTFQARPRSLDCRQACNSDVRCQSYNYLMFKDICELNNRTKEARPEDFVRNSERYYMKKAQNRVPLGSITELPADSCTEIKASEGPHAVSGNYWLDSTRSGNSIVARCDMETGIADYCIKHRCPNNATCVNSHVDYTCACNSSGWIGDYCERECHTALGMETYAITDQQITASSQWSINHAAVQGRLYFNKTGPKLGAWSPASRDTKEFFQVDLGDSYFVLNGIATQGRNGHTPVQSVTKYNLQYSNDAVDFQYYKEKGQDTEKEFAGNTDQDTVVSHELNPPIRARYIRFRPVAWKNLISLRVELYGCHDCQAAPLGMENGVITDGQISASSSYWNAHWNTYHDPAQGRMNIKETSKAAGAWSASGADLSQWFQVDLGSEGFIVIGAATQGRNGYIPLQCVTKYNLQYSDDEVDFQYYKEQGQDAEKEFEGNTDHDTVVYHNLNPPIRARYIRFRPVAWIGHISMRVELYSCQE